MTQPVKASTETSSEPVIDGDKALVLQGEVGIKTIFLGNALYAAAARGEEVIDLVIHSPGGSVYAGEVFIASMKAVQKRGVKIRCFVPNYAASMAFVIFTQCDERYALPNALLLFHPPRVAGLFLLTTQDAKNLAAMLHKTEVGLLRFMLPVMGVNRSSAAWFQENYLAERFFLATELAEESPKAWFTVLDRMAVK